MSQIDPEQIRPPGDLGFVKASRQHAAKVVAVERKFQARLGTKPTRSPHDLPIRKTQESNHRPKPGHPLNL